MDREIKVLMLEDVPYDAELQLHELRRAGLTCRSVRVQTELAFRQGLDEFAPDIVLSDFSLPGFDGLSALAIGRQKNPDVPFIFVSGTIGEERAIESFRLGATDYVLKTSLPRLAPAVRRALLEARGRMARRKAEQDLLASERKFRAIVETSQEWIWEIDGQGRCTFNSPFVHTLLGYRPEELLGTSSLIYLDAEDRARVEREFSEWIGEKRGWKDLVLRWRHKDGSYRCLESNAIPLLDAAGTVIGYRGSDRDVTERIHQQEKIVRLSRIQAVLSGINSTIVRIHDRQELFREACRIAVEHGKFRMAWIGLAEPGAMKARPVAWMGFEEGYLDEIGLSLSNVTQDHGAAGQALRSKEPVVANDIANDRHIVFKEEALARGYRSLVALPLLLEGEAIGVAVLYAAESGVFDQEELKLLKELAADISFALDHIGKEERLNYLSYYDTLTGLVNRQLFFDRLSQMLNTVDGEQRSLGVVMVDLQRFRNINDSFGRSAGDKVLKEFAERLRDTFCEPATLARTGGDRFAVAMCDVREAELALLIRHWVTQLQLGPFTIDKAEIRVSAKLGIALFPADGSNADSLFKNAEAALQRAKDTTDSYVFYSPDMNARVAEHLHFESRLRNALAQKQFLLHYQPKVNLKTRRIEGFEALLRWQDPQRGLISPLQFISILEQTGMIVDVGLWVIEQAVADRRRWLAQGLDVAHIAVNVSQVQVRQKDFVASVFHALGGAAKTLAGIDLEITESLIMEDTEASIQKLRELRAAGIRIFMDDFGTGYSSLSQLAQMPLDALKIDRAFIAGMADNAEAMVIVSTIITLARALKIGVVAEGVETDEQAGLLASLGCDQAQGYLFSRPLPAHDVAKLLAKPHL